MPSIKKLVKNPAKLVYLLNKIGVGKFIPDKPYIKLRFKADIGKKLNLDSP